MVETRRLSELRRRLIGLLDKPKGKLAVALSGGADSASLAYLLTITADQVRAIHVNHGFPASMRLEQAAADVAGKLALELDVVQIDVAGGPSPEGMARGARYEALIGRLGPDEILLTAHTLEDQAETVLMNLIRGSGMSGLAGIPRRGPLIARPMLEISRSETRELAALADLPFFDDPTNLDPTVRRNAIRLEILPHLSARFNPRLVEAIARMAALVRSAEEHLEGEAASVSLLFRGPDVAVAVGTLVAVPRAVADRALRNCLVRVRPPHQGTMSEMDQVWAVADRGQRSAILAGGIEVLVDGPLLVFRPTETGLVSAPETVELTPGMNLVDGFEVGVELVDRVCRTAPLGNWSAIFDPEARLSASIDEQGRLVVAADGDRAWVAGERRLGVAWYQPGSCGYLSVFAREGSGWTSSL